MDLRKVGGSGIVIMVALALAGMIYVWFMTQMGMNTALEIGISIGAFMFAVLFFLVYAGVRSVKFVRKVEG